jgi:hypothetical protein
MYLLKKVGLNIILFLIFSSYGLIAQTDTTKAQFKKYALQFEISNYFTLRSFQGSVISLKRNFSDKTALRIGISITGEVRDIDDRLYRPQNDSTITRDMRNDDLLDVEFSSQLIFYPVRNEIRVFVGSGPIIHYGSSKDVREYQIPERDDTSMEIKVWSFGLSFPFGVEWYFKKNMSISAEYGFIITYEWYNSENWRENLTLNGNDVRDINENIFRVASSSVLFGLSVYF